MSSESVFFVVLILSYVYFRESPTNVAGVDPSALDAGRASIFTACLLSSSITMWLAGRYQKRGKRSAMLAWLALTIGLGATFLYGEITDFTDLAGKQVTVWRDVFGSSFYTLVGLHGFHVSVGLAILAITFYLGTIGDFDQGRHPDAFDAISLYWHFVDIVWVVVFSTVFLWSML
jgi:heme/copper-type cytochrome/quinol oxidase subunit 3